jgi:transcriptional regulator with XRE-family HTH domain
LGVIARDRLKQKIDASGLSHEALAALVGVKQPTITRLVNGTQASTTRLHQIARELGTTPEYLSGETDDPLGTAPDVPPLKRGEETVLSYYRALDDAGRDAVTRVLRVLADKAKPDEPISVAPAPSEVRMPTESALTEMFQGLLRAPQTKGKSGDALARGLARLLPTGLRQVQGQLRIEQIDAADEQAELPEDQQRNRPERRQASHK